MSLGAQAHPWTGGEEGRKKEAQGGRRRRARYRRGGTRGGCGLGGRAPLAPIRPRPGPGSRAARGQQGGAAEEVRQAGRPLWGRRRWRALVPGFVGTVLGFVLDLLVGLLAAYVSALQAGYLLKSCVGFAFQSAVFLKWPSGSAQAIAMSWALERCLQVTRRAVSRRMCLHAWKRSAFCMEKILARRPMSLPQQCRQEHRKCTGEETARVCTHCSSCLSHTPWPLF